MVGRGGVLAAAAIGFVALLAGCSEEQQAGEGGSTVTTDATTSETAAASETSEPAETSGQSGSTPPETGKPTSAGCPVGEYQVDRITGKEGAEINGAELVVESDGGFVLEIDDDGSWQLTGSNAPISLSAAGTSVHATVDGQAEGSWAKSGDRYIFRQEEAHGRVTLSQAAGGVSSIPMSKVVPAIAPSGKVSANCGNGTLMIRSRAVDLKLTRIDDGG